MRKIITDNIFGKNLQKIRVAKRLTQEQTVAKLQLLGSPLTRGTYSLIEMGKRGASLIARPVPTTAETGTATAHTRYPAWRAAGRR